MHTIIEFFKNKWVIRLLGLTAASVIIWFIGPFVAIAGSIPLESVSARLITILIILLIWLTTLLLSHLKAQKKDKELMEKLGDDSSATDVEPSVESDQSAEERQLLQQRFDEALTVLKKNQQNESVIWQPISV